MRNIENSTQRMSHAMHNTQTDIRERHTCNVLRYRHAVTRLSIRGVGHGCFQMTGNHFDCFNLKHITHFPCTFSYQAFDGVSQSIQSGRSC